MTRSTTASRGPRVRPRRGGDRVGRRDCERRGGVLLPLPPESSPLLVRPREDMICLKAYDHPGTHKTLIPIVRVLQSASTDYLAPRVQWKKKLQHEELLCSNGTAAFLIIYCSLYTENTSAEDSRWLAAHRATDVSIPTTTMLPTTDRSRVMRELFSPRPPTRTATTKKRCSCVCSS